MRNLIYAVEVKGLQAQQWFRDKLQVLNNNRGSGIIEYIALAAVVIAFCAAAAAKGPEIGTAVSGKLTEIIGKIGS